LSLSDYLWRQEKAVLTIIDIHAHILPGVDDGAKNWEQSLAMAQMAVKDGISVIVVTPHLFKGRNFDVSQLNNKELILQHVAQLRQKLSEAKIPLEISPGCDFPLEVESLKLLEDGEALGRRPGLAH
jgi:protein-tyrosine phosphatase